MMLIIHHQDDHRLFTLFNSLLQEEPKKRPSAAKALKIMVQSIKKPIESTDNETRKQAKQFFVKKVGDEALRRCTTNDVTLFNLQANIENRKNVRADLQVLHQKTIIDGAEELIEIIDDLDVQAMFQSAEAAGKKVTIIVSENIPEMDQKLVAVPDLEHLHVCGSSFPSRAEDKDHILSNANDFM